MPRLIVAGVMVLSGASEVTAMADQNQVALAEIRGMLARANLTPASWQAAPEGKASHVGEALRAPVFSSVPTRFAYNGEDCWATLERWQQYGTAPRLEHGIERYAQTWTEPESGFRTTLEVILFEDPAGIEFQWRLENPGRNPSGLISATRSIDYAAAARDGQVVLHSCSGGLTGRLDGRPERTGFELAATSLGEKTLTVNGGRSSNGDLPFYLLTGLQGGWGLAMGLGWSGQWSAEGRYDAAKEKTTFTAGVDPCHFRLAPGESVMLPSALFVPFHGDAATGANVLRRMLRVHYQAKLGAQDVPPPVSFNSWFVFENRVNEQMLKDLADEAAPLGIEYFCLDSGWFDGDFPNGVGNWTVHRGKFPNGLKPVADHVHRLGMKFGLWFEPERVADGTRWQTEYPDLLLDRNLMDLGNPRAREIVLQLLDWVITEVGVDWIRYDFNMDPLKAWASVEGEEEKGLRQIRHIHGLYEVLAELMRRHPDLLIEQCASGGRRIDLETIRFGHTYWKSDDTFDQPLMRFHETGANHFLLGGHLNTNYCRYRSQSELIALFAGPLGFGVDFRALTKEQKEEVRQAVAAYKKVRRFINEDYYPLFPQTKTELMWCGWEFVDPVKQEGFFVVYRPEESPYDSATVSLRGLDQPRTYAVENLIAGGKVSKTSAELADGFRVMLERGQGKVWSFCSR